MRAGDIAASQQQTVNRFGNQTAIGDRVSLGLMEGFLRTGFIQTISGHVMDIEIEVSLCDDPVVKDPGHSEYLLR